MGLSRHPTVWNTSDLIKAASRSQVSIYNPDGTALWVPARPISFQYGLFSGLAQRLRVAYRVFTGRYDALEWDSQ